MEQTNEKNAENELDRDFNMGSFLLYVFPAIITYIFNGIYSSVDGAFIERFQGPYAIAAVSLYYPVLNIVLGIGTMIGTGGGVALAALQGEKKNDAADRLFSQLILTAAAIGMLTAVGGNIFSAEILHLLGATSGNITYAAKYYNIMITTSPILLFAAILMPLFLAEGKATQIAVTSVLGGILNMVLDYFFMGVLDWGISGSALATMIGYSVPFIYGIWFYIPCNRNGSRFHFRRTAFDLKKISSVMYNGSSEMVSFLANGITALIMNHLAYDLYREAGVSVVSVFLFIQFLIMAVFLAMTASAEPAVSYRYGEKDFPGVRHICRLSIAWTAIFSIMSFAALFLFRGQIVGIFFDSTGEDRMFYELGCLSMTCSIPATLVTGFNIIISGLFTAFQNGTVSALLSGLRTFFFFIAAMYGLTFLLGGTGLWLSWFGAELPCLLVSIVFLIKYRKAYLYGINDT